jgi:hypothetical protein
MGGDSAHDLWSPFRPLLERYLHLGMNFIYDAPTDRLPPFDALIAFEAAARLGVCLVADQDFCGNSLTGARYGGERL